MFRSKTSFIQFVLYFPPALYYPKLMETTLS